MIKKIVILGSSGSIGTQTLDVVSLMKDVQVMALSVNSNIELLREQIKIYKPKKAVVMDEDAFNKIRFDDLGETEILFGMEGLLEIASMKEANLIVNSLVGNIGLLPTVKAIENKKDIALANKETLVTAGEYIMNLSKENGVKIYPIDSEHSAIFQCLQGNKNNKISKIYLTASGGPFRTKNFLELSNVTVDDALKHPNWSMGKKITIDSSTLMNKGLEVIEAKWLFDIELDRIEVLVHPQSTIHSMIEYEDGAIIAQLGEADMRVPISYALNFPKRLELPYKKLNFMEYNSLTFEKPKIDLFPCLRLAFEALKIGEGVPAVINAANEVLVEKFLNKEISFLDIPKLIEKAMKAYTVNKIYSIDDILEADKWAREYIFKTCEVK